MLFKWFASALNAAIWIWMLDLNKSGLKNFALTFIKCIFPKIHFYVYKPQHHLVSISDRQRDPTGKPLSRRRRSFMLTLFRDSVNLSRPSHDVKEYSGQTIQYARSLLEEINAVCSRLKKKKTIQTVISNKTSSRIGNESKWRFDEMHLVSLALFFYFMNFH